MTLETMSTGSGIVATKEVSEDLWCWYISLGEISICVTVKLSKSTSFLCSDFNAISVVLFTQVLLAEVAEGEEVSRTTPCYQ
jgi:hypothetical protein